MNERGAVAFYRLYAARCREISREVSSEANRASLLTMAQVWMALADQADKIAETHTPEPAAAAPPLRVARDEQQPQSGSSTEP
jgi:hypothetical protein